VSSIKTKKMKKIVLFFLLGLIACDSDKINAASGQDVEAEFAYSGLAYDGCDTRIMVPNGSDTPTTYIASKATLDVLNKFIEAEQAKLPKGDYLMGFPVNISFKKTGQMGVLLCGWGYKSSVETIDIQKISRKN
jgi:hypothetical protein